MALWREAKQQFQLIFKFLCFLLLSARSLSAVYSRGHPLKQNVGESLNLAQKKPKKRQWKVKAQPENDDEEEEGIKEIG